MSFVTSLITGSFLAAIITAVFNRINSEKSSIHSESEWRADLYKLSQKTEISRQDLELFRTCLSATRGMGLNIFGNRLIRARLDKRNAHRYLEIDDICIFYYHYLVENTLNKKIKKELYVKGKSEKIVFRQLCRILLKSDWNVRDVKNSIINKLSCIVTVNEEDKKAVDILHEFFSSKKRSEIRKNVFPIIDKKQYKYFLWIYNDHKYIAINILKNILLFSFFTLFSLLINSKHLKTFISFFGKSFDKNLNSVENKFILFPLLLGIGFYVLMQIQIKFFKEHQSISKQLTINIFVCIVSNFLLCWALQHFASIKFNPTNFTVIFSLSIIYLHFVDILSNKMFGLQSIDISHDFV